MVVLHQQSDPKQRETEQQHQREHHPPSTANLAIDKRWRVSSAVRTTILSGIGLAHGFLKGVKGLVLVAHTAVDVDLAARTTDVITTTSRAANIYSA